MTSTSTPGPTLVIDSSLLLLLVVGIASRDHIARFKRTCKYTAADFDLLTRVIAPYGVILVTPNIVTEVSNFAGYLDGKLRTRCMQTLAALLQAWNEHYVSSAHLASSTPFLRLGLTDASIQELANEADTVLTDDLDLYVAVSTSGHTAINFNHVRAAEWGYS